MTANTGKTQQQRAYEFQVELQRHAQRISDRIDEAYMHVTLEVFRNIVVGGNHSPGTPVDTGFACNSWVVGVNEIGPYRQGAAPPKSERGKPVAIVSFTEGQAKVLAVHAGDTIHLTSNCAYMTALEDGHSGKAPTGMVWLAIHAAPQIVEEVVRAMTS
jgi:hypothetical protein